MTENFAKDKAAITGIGYTKITRNSGVPVGTLGYIACNNAIKDAGLKASDIDGILSYSMQDSISVGELSAGMGMKNIQWWNNIMGGGSQSCAVIAQAAMAIASGLCNHVLCYRAMNGRSGMRMGKLVGAGVTVSQAKSYPGGGQWSAPYGFAGPPMQYAMMARRHMAMYGTTNDHLGMIAVTLRSNAVKNERAIMRNPITLDDYRNSRWIAAPFHILDCCQETDAGCAMVVSRADLAKNMPHKPAYIMSFAYGGGPFMGAMEKYEDFTTMFPKYLAPGLFARAGITVKDVKVAELYDAFTFAVLCQIEDFGFCAKGEGGPFIAAGNIALNGRVPVGTHGGLLSEGYVHGFNNVAEGVSQVRGTAGERQVKNADFVLVSGFAGTFGSGLILRR